VACLVALTFLISTQRLMRCVRRVAGGEGNVFGPKGRRGECRKERAGDGPGTWRGEPEASGGGVACRGTGGGPEGPEASRGLCQVSRAMGMSSAGRANVTGEHGL
jgi:hypothetical protein